MSELSPVREHNATESTQPKERDVLLIVDDNEMNCDMLSRRLQRRGYETLVASDGLEALAIFEQNKHVDLVLLDIMMPRVNGLEVLQRLREQYSMAELPIIMVSAKAQSAAIVQALEDGANDYVTKPIDFPVVLARIRTQMSRKRAEEALRQSEAKNRAILSAIPDVMLLLGRDGDVLDFQGDKTTPKGTSEPDSWATWSAYLPEDFYDWLPQATDLVLNKEQGPQLFEFQINRDDVVTYYEARMVASGENEVLVLMRDITERQQMKRLRHEYLAILRHDLQTSLTSIHNALQLLAKHVEVSLPGQFKALLSIAHRKSAHLLRLIRDLIDIERLETGDMSLHWEKISLQEVIKEAMQFCQEAYGEQGDTTFVIEGNPQDANVVGDRVLLLQALNHLLYNAIKFTPSGESVFVRWETGPALVRLSITDRGPTIPEAFRSRIFQKYAQTRNVDNPSDESGLGMGISKAIVETLHGRIGVESALPEGNTFFIELPVAESVQFAPNN